MATISAVNRPNGQSRTGLGAVLKYTMQEKKTVWEGEKLVSGLNCIPENAYDEFIGTKVQFGKDGGRMYYHFVQSFPPDEKITPKQAHEFALEFAKHWQGFEVVVSTHSDRDHLHSHFIINSVSFEDGKKYHCDRDEIKALQRLNDELGMRFGYSVCRKKKQTEGTKNMSQAEYHSALRSESWKMALRIAIDDAMKYATSRIHFIEIMNSEGYFVRWEKDRKSITYTCPAGMKCRGEKLNEKKYLKEVMENEFRIRKSIITGTDPFADESEHGDSDGRAVDGSADGQELGRLEQQRETARRSVFGELGSAPAAGNGTADEGVSGGTDTESAVGRERDGVERGRNADDNAGNVEQSVGQTEDADGGIDPCYLVTGWESEREFFLGVLRNEGRYDKMAEKNHVDRAHTVGAGLRPGTAALNTLSGLRQVFGDSDRPNDPDEDEDDIDKELRRQERAVKDGINLVM